MKLKFKGITILAVILIFCLTVAGVALAFAEEKDESIGIGKNIEDWTASSQGNVSVENDTIFVKKYASLKTPLNSDYIRIEFAFTANADTIDGQWRDYVMVLADETDIDPVYEFENRSTGKLTRNSLVITVGVRDNQWNVCIGGNVLEQPGTENAYTWYNITGNDGDAYALSDYTKPIVFEMYLTAENPSIRVSQEGSSFSGYTYTPTNSLIYFVRQWWMQNAMGETYLSIQNYEANETQTLGIASIETSPIEYGTDLGITNEEEWTSGSAVSVADGIAVVTGQAGLVPSVYVDDTTVTVGALQGNGKSEYALILSKTRGETFGGLTDGLALSFGVETGNWYVSVSLYNRIAKELFAAGLDGFSANEPLTVRFALIGQDPVIEFYCAGVRKSYSVSGFDRSFVAGSDLKSYLSIDYVGSGTAYGIGLTGIRTLEIAPAGAIGAKASEWSLSNEFTARQYADGVGVMALANTLAVPLESEYVKVTFSLSSVPETGWFNINFSAVEGYMAEGYSVSTEAADSGKTPANPVLGFSFHVASNITHMTTKVFYTAGSEQGDTVHKLTDDAGLKFIYPSGQVLPIIFSEEFSIIISMPDENPVIMVEQGRNSYSFSSFNCEAIAEGVLSKNTYADAEGKTYLSIGSSSTDMEIKVTGIETSASAPDIEPPENVSIVINASVPSSAPVNEEFIIPTPTVIMTGGSGYKTSIVVEDPDENPVEVVENKFIPVKEGVYKIIYTAVDNWGTTDTAEYKLRITNATPPTLVIDGSAIPKTGTVGVKVMLPSATITDDTDPSPVEMIVVKDGEGKEVIVVNGGFTPETEGVYTVQYIATDSDNNIARSQVFNITITAEQSGGCNSSVLTPGLTFMGATVISAIAIVVLKKSKRS